MLGIGLLCAPAFAAAQAPAPPIENGPTNNMNAPDNLNGPNDNGPNNNGPNNNVMPDPGTVNYVEGAVYLDGHPLGKNSVGNAQMAADEVLETHNGMAEILLDPGIYLRVGDHSSVRMISPYITPTRVDVLRGHASVEVDQLLKENVLQVVDHGVTTQLVKTGYYEFNGNTGRVKVFKGQAEVEYAPGKWAKVKGNHDMALVPGAKEQEAKFHPNPQEDQLMNWSKLRSQYLAEANQQMAPDYYGPGYDPGWYWDPYMWNYTFIGGGPFYSPFGWGFYPLGWGMGGLGWGGGWGGFYGRGFYHAPGHAGFYGGHGFHGVGGGTFHGGTAGGGAFGGFHGGMGGGFHGGARR